MASPIGARDSRATSRGAVMDVGNHSRGFTPLSPINGVLISILLARNSGKSSPRFRESGRVSPVFPERKRRRTPRCNFGVKVYGVQGVAGSNPAVCQRRLKMERRPRLKMEHGTGAKPYAVAVS